MFVEIEYWNIGLPLSMDEIMKENKKRVVGMNVGIVTCFYAHNYGAVLQCYALKEKVKEIGHRPIIVNHIPPGEQLKLFRSWLKLRDFVLNIFTLIRLNKRLSVFKKFAEFRETWLGLSDPIECCNERNLSVLECQAFITGSDQVWNPNLSLELNHYYFLSQGFPSKTRKISYAPSFGVSEVNGCFSNKLKSWIKNISFLSIRETTGAEIINNVTGRDAKVVLDPTLLLPADQWEAISTKPRYTFPYILVFGTTRSGGIGELVRYVKRQTGLPVVSWFV